MTFRKLYWIVESVHADKTSSVQGVYTSIVDLIDKGLGRRGQGPIRLSLTKLDDDQGVLGTWMEADQDGLTMALEPYWQGGTFDQRECSDLVHAFCGSPV